MFSPASLYDGSHKLSGVLCHVPQPAGQVYELHDGHASRLSHIVLNDKCSCATRRMMETEAVCSDVMLFGLMP